jgi:hypothetical protein
MIDAQGRCNDDNWGRRAELRLQARDGRRIYATVTRDGWRLVLEGQVEGYPHGFKMVSQ